MKKQIGYHPDFFNSLMRSFHAGMMAGIMILICGCKENGADGGDPEPQPTESIFQPG